MSVDKDTNDFARLQQGAGLILKKGILMCRLFLFTLVGLLCVWCVSPAFAVESTYWQHDPATPGDWFEPTNWTDGLPDSSNFAYVENGGTVEFNAGSADALGLRLGYTSGTAGTLNQAGGTLNLPAGLSLGQYGSGTYWIQNGELNSGGILVGDDGPGLFQQTGGDVDISGELVVCYGNQLQGGYGRYEFDAGTLTTAGRLYIGRYGIGEFIQTGGVYDATDIFLGFNNGDALYELSGTGQLTARYIELRNEDVFRQSGGTNTVANLNMTKSL